VRRPRIEPDVERVGELAIALLVDAEILARRFEPALDTVRLDLRRGELEARERIGMQRVGLAIDEERQRHAPLPLPRERPVGPVRDHAVKARLAPRREEPCVFDAAQRRFAQRLGRLDATKSGHFVHAREPLRRGAIDDRRLVSPAMHVAVRKLLRMEQRVHVAQLVDDLRVRVPDLQPAEVGQALGIASVALNRIEYLVVGHAVAVPVAVFEVDALAEVLGNPTEVLGVQREPALVLLRRETNTPPLRIIVLSGKRLPNVGTRGRSPAYAEKPGHIAAAC